MSDLNKQLARIFKDMSSMYEYMGGNERFRALAYNKASRIIGNLEEDVKVDIANDTLEDIDGIGESIAEKIIEYVKTGKIKKYEELRKKVPSGVLDLIDVKGFGPQSLKAIHNALGVTTREQIVKALETGKVSKLKGFGAKKADNMLRGLKLHKTVEERMLLWDALELADKIIGEMKGLQGVKKIDYAGSLRRKKETIGDIDILITCAPKDRKKIVDAFTGRKDCERVLANGDTKASIIISGYDKQVDLRIVNENEWGSALQYFTGSKEHNVHLRTIARNKGYKINEYGLFRNHDNKRVAGKTEEEIYDTLGFQIMPPEMREDKGEIELSAKHKIPKLVELGDIKGDLHLHSTWSDGALDIEALGRFVIKNYPYEYIALTDHSKTERIAHGMDERGFEKQAKEIEKVNKKLGRNFIKRSCEVDILNDGKLDLNNTLLSELDWVCASIHTSLEKDGTERLIAACENPLVSSIGHPTGRLIGKREGYPVDWKKVFPVAARTGTAFEINCQPTRMDMNDDLARLAREEGVMITISTDSHAEGNFAFMKLGISIAKRAWCTKKDILNTRSWADLKAFYDKKKSKISGKR